MISEAQVSSINQIGQASVPGGAVAELLRSQGHAGAQGLANRDLEVLEDGVGQEHQQPQVQPRATSTDTEDELHGLSSREVAARIRQIRDKYREKDARTVQPEGQHGPVEGYAQREHRNVTGAATSTLLGQSSTLSGVSKGGGYYGAPGPLPDLTQEMLRVEADIQMINSQIRNGPGQAAAEGGLGDLDQRRKRDSTMDKIEALLLPDGRRAEVERGSAVASNALDCQTPTLSRLLSVPGAQKVNDAHAQAGLPTPDSAAKLHPPPGSLASGSGPARYRAPPSIGDIQAAFKIEGKGGASIGTAQLSEMSSSKPSIPGLVLQDLAAQPSLHAQTERPPAVSHAIHASGFQYPLPAAQFNSKYASEEYFQQSRAPRAQFEGVESGRSLEAARPRHYSPVRYSHKRHAVVPDFNAQESARRATFGTGVAAPLGTVAEDAREFERESWNARDPIRQPTRSTPLEAMQPAERRALPGSPLEGQAQPQGSANAPSNANSTAAAHAIKALQEKNYRFECDLQVMESLLKQYKNQNQELEEQLEVERQRNRDVQASGQWVRERDELLDETKLLRQVIEKTKQDAEKEVKESQVETAHLRSLNKMLEEEVTTLRSQLSEGQAIQLRQHSELAKALENEKDAQARSERLLQGEKFRTRQQEKELVTEQHNFKMYKEQVAEYNEQLKKEISEKAKMIEDLEKKHAAEKRALRLELRLAQRELENGQKVGSLPSSRLQSPTVLTIADLPQKSGEEDVDDEKGELPHVRIAEFSGRKSKGGTRRSSKRSSKSRSPGRRRPPRSSQSQSKSPGVRSRRSSAVADGGAQLPSAARRPSRSSSREPTTHNESVADLVEPLARKRSVDFKPPLQPSSLTQSVSAPGGTNAPLRTVSATPLIALAENQNIHNQAAVNEDIKAEESSQHESSDQDQQQELEEEADQAKMDGAAGEQDGPKPKAEGVHAKDEIDAVEKRREAIRKQLGLAVLDTELELPPPEPTDPRKDVEQAVPSPAHSANESLRSISRTSGRSSRQSLSPDSARRPSDLDGPLRASLQRVTNPLRTHNEIDDGDSEFQRQEDSSSSSEVLDDAQRRSSATSTARQQVDTQTQQPQPATPVSQIPRTFLATVTDARGFGSSGKPLLVEQPLSQSAGVTSQSRGATGPPESEQPRPAPPGTLARQQTQLSEQPALALKTSMVGTKKTLKRRPTEPSLTPLGSAGKAPKGKDKDADAAMRRSTVSPAALTSSKKPAAGKPPSSKPPSAAAKQATPSSKRQSIGTSMTSKKKLPEVKASPARPLKAPSKLTAKTSSVAKKSANAPSVKGKAASKTTTATKKAAVPVKVVKKSRLKYEQDSMRDDDEFSSPQGELEDEDDRRQAQLTERNLVGELLYQSQDMASTRYLAGATPGQKHAEGSSAALSKSSSRFLATAEKNLLAHEIAESPQGPGHAGPKRSDAADSHIKSSKYKGSRQSGSITEKNAELIISINKHAGEDGIEAVVANGTDSASHRRPKKAVKVESAPRHRDEGTGGRKAAQSGAKGGSSTQKHKGPEEEPSFSDADGANATSILQQYDSEDDEARAN